MSDEADLEPKAVHGFQPISMEKPPGIPEGNRKQDVTESIRTEGGVSAAMKPISIEDLKREEDKRALADYLKNLKKR